MAGQAFGFQITGLRELDGLLKQLPRAMSNTVMRNALKKAGEPTRAAGEANAPVEAGGLKESIQLSAQLNRNQRRGRPRIKEGAEIFIGSTSPLGHLVEFGTAERYRKSGGSTGVMPAKAFMTQAWDATKDGALEILRKELWAELAKAVKRLRKRAEKGTLSIKAMREMQAM